ncbi:MAG: SWIM zinc finger family protein [Synergistaceae bacterium]|nr:SWIM zinc finger family protein [Synergistaceae bacterium]
MGWYDYNEYVPVAKKKEKAIKQIEKLRKKDTNLSPVVIEGRKITKTWWGDAWCKNLESYADFSNRIGRGSAYIKNGFVIDLKIYEGLVTGKVMGTRLYNVNIKIDLLSESLKKDIIKMVGRRIDSVSDLIDGKFPGELRDFFLTQKKGLFPAPNEIHMNCSCPDWADMCKHVAAVLYGVGARLDQNPLLFFELRGVDVNAFIKASIDDKISILMRNAGKSTDRVINNADISEIFGV